MKNFIVLLILFTSACAGGVRPPQPPVEPEPTKQAMAVVVKDFISPEISVSGVLVTCNMIERGHTNDDGYLVFDEYTDTVVKCSFQKDGYYPGEANHYLTPADPTLYMPLTAEVPPVPTTPAPIVGRVRLEGGCMRDDTGCINPVYAHAGDLFSLYTRNPARALQELDKIATVGFQGLRTWSSLGGSYWNGREVGPSVTTDYYGQVRNFFSEARSRGLRIVWSQGDIAQLGDRRTAMSEFARIDNELGGVIDFIDCGNEAWQTGEPDPAKLAECIGYYQSAGGRGLKSTTSADGDPTFADINKWSIPPSDVFDVHSWRGGHSWDKRRHIWSYGYGGEGSTRLPFGIGSEPPGSGQLVSVTSNKHELDDEAVALLAVASMTGRQAFVWFSGEGVKIDQGLQVESGFSSVPRMIAKLPKDLMTYHTSHHSGTTWASIRVLEPRDDVRVDGRMHNDGRFVYVIDGPSGTYRLRVARSFSGQLCDPGTVECTAVQHTAGQSLDLSFRRGRVLIGQVQ